MCGFVGFIDENDQTYDHRATIVAMANAIAHRGPDSEGYFSDGRAALGFRRLAIIDLAGANQPLYNENRLARARLQRRNLQLPGTTPAADHRRSHLLHPGRCGSDAPRVRAVGRRGARPFARHVRVRSVSPSHRRAFSARATPSASSPSTMPWKASASCSAPRSRGLSRIRARTGA